MDLAGLALEFEPRLRPAVVMWSQLTPWQRRGVTFDDLAAVAGLAPGEFVSAITRAAFEYTEGVADLIAVSALPEMVSAAVKRAITPEGVEDRRMFLEHSGILERMKEIPNHPGAATPVQPPGPPGTKADAIAPQSEPEPVPWFLRPEGGREPSATCRPETAGTEPSIRTTRSNS